MSSTVMLSIRGLLTHGREYSTGIALAVSAIILVTILIVDSRVSKGKV